MKKRIVSVISWLLAVAMLVSLPVCAFAEETDWEGESSSQSEEKTPADEEKDDGTDEETPEAPTEPALPEWKNDEGFNGFVGRLIVGVTAYKSYDGKEKAASLAAGTEITVTERMTVNKVIWWKLENGSFVIACGVNQKAETPVADTTVAKNSLGTLTGTQKAYTSPKDGTVVGTFDKDYQFTILETQKYLYDIWGKAKIDGQDAWFNLSTVTVTKPGTGTGTGSGSGSTGSDSGYPKGVIANTESVNVRNKASTSGKLVGTLKRGAEVTIYEKQQHSTTKVWWARIGEDRWVCMQYITITSGNTGSGSGTGNPPEDAGEVLFKGVVTSNTNLRVRQKPGISEKQVGSLPKGTEVSVYETSTVKGVEWGRIGVDKWVSLQYVQVTEKNPGASDPDKDDDTTVSETPIATGSVTSNANLKVRTGAGTNYPIVTSLVTGSKISIYAYKTVNGTQWGRIGKDQWVCMTYVKVDSGSTGSGSGDSTSVTANATIVNCSVAVNVRATPSVTGAFVAQIKLNTRVYISETKKASNGTLWGKVDNGWVCMDYVKMDDGSNVDDGTGSVSTTTGAPYANITVPATVSNDDTPVYVNADASSKKLVVLSSGAEISITGRALANGKQWGKVSVGGYTGWVEMEKVTLKNISATVSTAQATVYDAPSTSGKQVVIWGKGQTLTIIDQKTDGTYLWGRVKGTAERWVNMANLALNTGSSSGSTAPAATISITATVNVEQANVYKSYDGATNAKLLGLVKGTKITIEDLQVSINGKVWGRVTLKNITASAITGWVDMSNLTQASVTGKVKVDSAQLYRKLGGSAADLTLKKDNSVVILERTKYNDEVYGELKINSAYYWIRMSDVTLDGSGNTGNTGTTGSTGSDTPSGATNVSGVVNYRYLNVRSEASATSKLVTQLKQGDKVTVYEQTTTNGAAWGRIDQGWVAMEYINLSSRPTSTGTTVSNSTIMTSVPSGAVAVGFVNYDGLSIRSGAGTGYDRVGTLKKGTNVVITEQKLSGGMIWGKIDKGWICTSYVTMTGASITGSGSTGTIARCAYTVNVRSNPGVGNALVAKLLVNSRVEIYETKVYSGEQWGRTSLGWISMEYVLMDN